MVVKEMKNDTSANRKAIFISLGGAALILVITVIIALVNAVNRRTQAPAPPAPTMAREVLSAPESQAEGGRGTVITSDNARELLDQLNQPMEDAYYETSMNVEWLFGKSTEPSSNAYVENSTSNRRTVYFDLTLEETNELLYSSPFIPVGAVLEDFALDVELPQGSHKAVVTYHLVDDDYQNITSVSVGVTLIVEG